MQFEFWISRDDVDVSLAGRNESNDEGKKRWIECQIWQRFLTLFRVYFSVCLQLTIQ